VSDGASSDTSSYELEQPSLVRFTVNDHAVSPENNDTYNDMAGHVDQESLDITGSQPRDTAVTDGAVTDDVKMSINDENLMSFNDDTPSLTRQEPAWLDVAQTSGTNHRSTSHTSLISDNT